MIDDLLVQYTTSSSKLRAVTRVDKCGAMVTGTWNDSGQTLQWHEI